MNKPQHCVRGLKYHPLPSHLAIIVVFLEQVHDTASIFRYLTLSINI
jgi:hypothetical protein